MKPTKAFLGFAVFLLCLAALPVPTASFFRSSVYSVLKYPLALSSLLAQSADDLFHFKRNAEDNERLREALTKERFRRFQSRELILENARLRQLIDLRQTLPLRVKRTVFARVIGRSPATWRRVLLIDKGARHGLERDMPVLSGHALIGKIIETGPSAAKVLLITDPNSRVSVITQTGRRQGVLFGTASGQCRMKYLSVDVPIERGDFVETAGLGGVFPKGLPVGTLELAWKEPGQIYQVARVKPLIDFNRIEEVVCVDAALSSPG